MDASKVDGGEHSTRLSAGAMNTVTPQQRLLLQKLAAKEAAKRQQQASLRRSDELSLAGPSSRSTEEAEPAEGVTDRIAAVYKEEKARNDVQWDRIRNKFATLGEDEPALLDERGQKLNQLAMIEDEIAVLSRDVEELKPPQSELALSLITRSLIASSIKQHEAGITFKRQDIEEEQASLDMDTLTLRQLQDVQTGLEAKRASLISKEAEEKDQGSVIRSLREKVATVESNLEHLLSSLVKISNSLFDDHDGDKGRHLRHLIDRLVNAAWDSPDNPWVEVDKQYPASFVTFLVRANIAVEHPRDARNLRLVQFHR